MKNNKIKQIKPIFVIFEICPLMEKKTRYFKIPLPKFFLKRQKEYFGPKDN